MHTFRPSTRHDYSFLYRLNETTMKEYVDQSWGWDDSVQKKRFQEHFHPGRDEIIVVGGQDVGMVCVEERAGEILLAGIKILPQFQRKGLGTTIIRKLLADARRSRLPVRLRVLKVNPVKQLYERLGFEVTQETDTHYLMTAAPADGGH